jgi:hypothetical protein
MWGGLMPAPHEEHPAHIGTYGCLTLSGSGLRAVDHGCAWVPGVVPETRGKLGAHLLP